MSFLAWIDSLDMKWSLIVRQNELCSNCLRVFPQFCLGGRRNSLDKIVSAAMDDKMIRRGCEAYPAHMVDVEKPSMEGKFIP